MNSALMSLLSKVRLSFQWGCAAPATRCPAITKTVTNPYLSQGNEAGGHGLGSALPLLTLFPLVSSLWPPAGGPPLLAAGGLANGAHVAALLALGASGAVLGTRFLLSPESLYTPVQRRALLAADSTQSVRTMAFDYARNTLGWPAGIDGRALKNGAQL